jgi:hypothetical protein
MRQTIAIRDSGSFDYPIVDDNFKVRDVVNDIISSQVSPQSIRLSVAFCVASICAIVILPRFSFLGPRSPKTRSTWSTWGPSWTDFICGRNSCLVLIRTMVCFHL